LIRFLYTLAWVLALPLVIMRLWLRGRREPGYRQHIGERLGLYGHIPTPTAPVLWVHAVSVGETRAAEPLIDALLQAYPGHTILLTHMTPTGRATGQALFATHLANSAPRVQQCYLPYDIGPMVARFLRHFRPRICILMETEVWPNTVAQCTRHQVPMALVNARLSARSLKKGQRMAALMRDAAEAIDCVAAQTAADAERLEALGARHVQVTGSIKFDVMVPAAAALGGAEIRKHFGARPVLLCASTRDGEEALILDAMTNRDLGDALVVIVPRHPQRFDEVARMITARGFALARRSTLAHAAPSDDIHVLLGDSMGEMFSYYAACDVAFIGGSLLPLGGQNLIEALALGKPVLLGPHTFNFSLISDDAIEAGAALRVTDAADMLNQGLQLLHASEERRQRGDKASAFAAQHRGAAQRTVSLLRPLIDVSVSAPASH
jgi:3-deoxy-D-manno-octulosonic-acid transferase